MSEPTRRDLQESWPGPDRAARTESLLVEGLDLYLQGDYDAAIHLWTRLLFIDRHHARARAYISRARAAIGERQRRTDEALGRIDRFLDEGCLDQARVVLSTIGRAAGADEAIAQRWARLERLARVHRPDLSFPSHEEIAHALPVNRRLYARLIVHLLAATAFGLLVATLIESPVISEWISGASDGFVAPTGTPEQAVEALPATDVALIRARSLFARGRLPEAMSVLERVEGSPEADALRAEIQRWLLLPRTAGERRDVP
jgi:tetratricopeptide (TPR) repeat protein